MVWISSPSLDIWPDCMARWQWTTITFGHIGLAWASLLYYWDNPFWNSLTNNKPKWNSAQLRLRKFEIGFNLFEFSLIWIEFVWNWIWIEFELNFNWILILIEFELNFSWIWIEFEFEFKWIKLNSIWIKLNLNWIEWN